MAEQLRPQDMAKKAIVYKITGMDDVTVKRDIEYATNDSRTLRLDVYQPANSEQRKPLPIVIFVIGYPGAGSQKIFGCETKDMGCYVSWAKLAAASGIAAITYNNREPVADIDALLRYVRQNSTALGIDENRIGIWSCSGNVPTAVSLAMQPDSDYLKCAVLCYGAMLDIDGSTGIADSSRAWGFANPSAGKSLDEIRRNLPLFIARAGQDEIPHVNDSIDRFVAEALSCNLPVTIVNHATGPHWFDVMDDSEPTRQVIKQILDFLIFHLV